MHALKLTQIGNSVGLILPEEVLERLNLGSGDTVFLIDAPSSVTITPHDPNRVDQLDLAREIMQKRRVVLRELAK